MLQKTNLVQLVYLVTKKYELELSELSKEVERLKKEKKEVLELINEIELVRIRERLHNSELATST